MIQPINLDYIGESFPYYYGILYFQSATQR